MQNRTIYQLIFEQIHHTRDSIAIYAPSRSPLSYSKLLIQINQTVTALGTMGIGRGDRVALVLPNSPEMVVAFLAVSACAVCAPLNPAYSELEFASYYSTLNIKAVIIQAGIDSPAKDVAKAQGVVLIELTPVLQVEAGIFTLHGDANPLVNSLESVQPEDIALIMHTSGTTSKPKTVPITHFNLCASVHNIRTSLSLQPDDRCLNVMPLFHSHGLIGACLTSLATGASVICTSGFNAVKFFDWMEEFHPTWYTAVPTMHQAILTEAEPKYQKVMSSLRLIRSTSAALPPTVMTELELVFKVPIIEAYATLEALQITSNPLPPKQRKLRSGGVAVGTEVGIMDASGHLLGSSEIGEIVVRGTNVIAGYENNSEANQQGFIDRWLRTGDQGYLDEDGYLFLTGRLKEIINRGGETIAPREIDEVLLGHPSVLQAIAFAVPHPRLGEDVAAAVVLKQKASASKAELREFAATRLADFKVPSRIIFVDEIPKGATGKLQRIGLANVFASQLRSEFVAPETPLEKQLATLWTNILGVEQIGIHDNFFALGGESLQAVALITEIETAIGRELPPDTIFRTLTIEQLANTLSKTAQSATESPLVPIQPKGDKPPIFAVHDISGEVFCYRSLVQYLDPNQPFYGLQASKMLTELSSPPRVEAIAAHYLTEIQTLQPRGPYFLLGYSFGGLVAFEIAQQLHQQGQHVAFLGLLDTIASGDRKPFTPYQKITRHLRYFLQTGSSYLSVRLNKRWISRKGNRRNPPAVTPTSSKSYSTSTLATLFRQVAYVPQMYPGRITFFLPIERETYQEWLIFDPEECWSKRTTETLEMHLVPGGHAVMMAEPHVQNLAEQIKACLKTLHDYESVDLLH